MDKDMEQAHSAQARTGVLLVNLGTPQAPTASAIRAYLRQFLSDQRVVELPRLLWLPILYGFILPFRPRKLVHAYAKVWGEDGSPLMAISRRQAKAVQKILGEDPAVELAMTYGEPSIDNALSKLESQGVGKVLILPLYPQYSGTTTAATMDALFAALGRRRWLPEIRTINSYHDEPSYIQALAKSVESHWLAAGRGDHLLMSFHSIPRKYLEKGDPYFCQCHKTARLLAERLQLQQRDWSISFQSRLGRQPWLQPYSDLVIPQLARTGQRKLDVICPGFSADCLETLEEVAIRYADDFTAAGGEALRYIPALNDQVDHINCIASLLSKHSTDWSTIPRLNAHELEARQDRVRKIMPALHSPELLAPPR